MTPIFSFAHDVLDAWLFLFHMLSLCQDLIHLAEEPSSETQSQRSLALLHSKLFPAAPYTTLSEPQGVIYEDKLKRKRLMRAEELYKISDGTLSSVRNALDQMLKNLRFGYNKVMNKRKWTATDQRWTHIMIKDINQQLLHRRITGLTTGCYNGQYDSVIFCSTHSGHVS
ncbi:hypothetical protein Tco_0205229 [Tanacetum coccineum]